MCKLKENLMFIKIKIFWVFDDLVETVPYVSVELTRLLEVEVIAITERLFLADENETRHMTKEYFLSLQKVCIIQNILNRYGNHF